MSCCPSSAVLPILLNVAHARTCYAHTSLLVSSVAFSLTKETEVPLPAAPTPLPPPRERSAPPSPLGGQRSPPQPARRTASCLAGPSLLHGPGHPRARVVARVVAPGPPHVPLQPPGLSPGGAHLPPPAHDGSAGLDRQLSPRPPRSTLPNVRSPSAHHHPRSPLPSPPAPPTTPCNL